MCILCFATPCSEVVWWVQATHSIRQFPLHFPPCVSVCHHVSTGLYQDLDLPFGITVLHQLTAVFWKLSLALSDMTPKNMSQYIWRNLHVDKTSDIKIISHSFALIRTDCVNISRYGNNRMLQSYCHTDYGITFMFWRLNVSLLFHERNSIVLSLQIYGCVMLYSFLFLILSGIHFTFMPPMRLNGELLKWLAETLFGCNSQKKLTSVKRKHISYFTVRAYTNIPYQIWETAKNLTSSRQQPVQMLLNWLSKLFWSQLCFSKETRFWTTYCSLSGYLVFKIKEKGVYIHFRLSQTECNEQKCPTYLDEIPILETETDKTIARYVC